MKLSSMSTQKNFAAIHSEKFQIVLLFIDNNIFYRSMSCINKECTYKSQEQTTIDLLLLIQ